MKTVRNRSPDANQRDAAIGKYAIYIKNKGLDLLKSVLCCCHAASLVKTARQFRIFVSMTTHKLPECSSAEYSATG